MRRTRTSAPASTSSRRARRSCRRGTRSDTATNTISGTSMATPHVTGCRRAVPVAAPGRLRERGAGRDRERTRSPTSSAAPVRARRTSCSTAGSSTASRRSPRRRRPPPRRRRPPRPRRPPRRRRWRSRARRSNLTARRTEEGGRTLSWHGAERRRPTGYKVYRGTTTGNLHAGHDTRQRHVVQQAPGLTKGVPTTFQVSAAEQRRRGREDRDGDARSRL